MAQSIELFEITPGDWSQFGPRIVRFEDQFHPNLRDDDKCLRGLVESETSIVIGARCEKTPLAAYVASDMLEHFSKIPGTKSDPHFGDRDTHYIASIVVAPEFQHRRITTKPYKKVLVLALQRKFRRVTAHMKAGSAKKIDQTIRVLQPFPDWYGTGEVYEYVELPPSFLSAPPSTVARSVRGSSPSSRR
jgi:hypothetical protein